MYKFIIPLFALAFLLVSCAPSAPQGSSSTSSAMQKTTMNGKNIEFDGKILSGHHTVVMSTSMGDITLDLNADAAPRTVTNFITLAKAGFYDGITFHRVIAKFMIQGGDPDGDGAGGGSIFGDTFDDEINAKSYGLDKMKVSELITDQPLAPDVGGMSVMQAFESQGYHYNDKLTSIPLERGAIAMANRGPNTNGSQFFILQAEKTPLLNGRYTVFGKVTKGLDVVDAIANVKTGAKDKPVLPVTFTVKVIN